jgi:AcrR family transcriptional regulator
MITRTRFDAQDRRAQLLDVTAEIVLEQGALPLSLTELGARAQVSKGLIYKHFASQHDLFNALLAQLFLDLTKNGLLEASRDPDHWTAALKCAAIYFDHVVRRGTLVNIILRDPFMKDRLLRSNIALRDRLAVRFARAARREFTLARRDSVAFFHVIVAIPEETGRLARDHELSPERALHLCQSMVASAIKSVTPPGPVSHR